MEIILLILIGYFIKYIYGKYKENKIQINNSLMQINTSLAELNRTKQSLSNKERELLEKERELKILINDTSQTCTWLAKRISDFTYAKDLEKSKYLVEKKQPAYKASEIVKQISEEKRELLKNNKVLEYQLDFLTSTFPMLEDAMQLDTNELENAIEEINTSNEAKDEYEVLKKYLSPEEYKNLSHIQKYQLALDRYCSKSKKSLWQIGRDYERYIGYVYENKNYKVTYNGALEGLNDLGRDITAENKKEILIIQCKYWRKEKIIRENVVFQLYGTVILKQLETEKKVKGILITTTTLSEEAKKIANCLNIKVIENESFDKEYPCIKCNINKTTKEKIYHLPFDQQYDRINISLNNGELYVKTVKEAEDLQFRRAKRHYFNNK